jgi:SAM-dependent methyltransferase
MDAQTIYAYDKCASEYADETQDFWKGELSSFLNLFADAVGVGHILNVGSGPGFEGLILQNAGLTVTCLDASATMVSLCREKGLSSVQGDFMSLPFTKTSFDGVWAYTSLLHIERSLMPAALQELGRVMRPGSYLGLGMIEGGGSEYRPSLGKGYERLFTYYRKDELEGLLTTSGFEVVSTGSFTPKKRTFLDVLARRIAQ